MMAVVDAYVFAGFLTPILTQFSFQSYRLHFSRSSAEVRSEKNRRKSNSQPPGNTSDTLTTEPSSRGPKQGMDRPNQSIGRARQSTERPSEGMDRPI